MKYLSKQDLVADIRFQRTALIALLGRVPREEFLEPGVWGDEWTVTDLLTHLAAWHELCHGWYIAGLRGQLVEMPAPGFKWNETPRLNSEIQARYRDITPEASLDWFSASHRKLADLAASLTEEDLIKQGRFAWTGKNALVVYLSANTASHYRFAQKVLKRWLRQKEARKPS